MSSTQPTGLLIAYTGAGKGKTTAAFGLALRFLGHDLPVHVLQFMKGRFSGETAALLRCSSEVRVEQFGGPQFVNRLDPSPQAVDSARRALDRARQILSDPNPPALLILDELHVAIDYGLIDLADVMQVLADRGTTNVVTTGRHAPSRLLDAADTVTEMREIRHHIDRGFSASEGVEY